MAWAVDPGVAMRSAVLGSILLASCALACGSPDYGSHERRNVVTDPSDPAPGGSTNEGVAPTGTDAPPAATTSSSSSSSSGATPVAVDAGTPPPPAATTAPNAFTGAAAYVSTAGASTTVTAHGTNGDPAGKACFSCHGGGGAGPSMTMGGTVYADAAGTTPLANAEIRLVVGGTATSAYTNATGNFFVLGARLAATGVVGARNAASAHTMTDAVASGDCNSCHDGTTTARIHLP